MAAIDTRYVLNLTKSLCKIPSISENSEEENRCAEFIYNELCSIAKQSKTPLKVKLINCEKDILNRKAVLALLRAPRKTDKTVLLTGHFDVVSTDVCGSLSTLAFDPDAYTKALHKAYIDEQSREDLESGNWLFGRGVMDMKYGLSMFIGAIKTLSQSPDLRINIAFLAVPDEESNSAGMIGSINTLTKFIKSEKLHICAALTGEPCFATTDSKGHLTRPYYTGTTGKLLLMFFVIGRECHVNNYFEGFNSSLLASSIVNLMDGNENFLPSEKQFLLAPPSCLHVGTRAQGYSVTLPGKADAYFNVLTVKSSPDQVLKAARRIAQRACNQTLKSLKTNIQASGISTQQPLVPIVYSVAEVEAAAKNRFGSEAKFLKAREQFRKTLDPRMDKREFSTLETQWIWDRSELKEPAVVVGFLPPYYPARLNKNKSQDEINLRAIITEEVARGNKLVGSSANKMIEVFSGITDLSFLGYDGNEHELKTLQDNMPGWGSSFWLPINLLSQMNIPVANMGPSGKDAHEATERLELNYSLKVAPKLLLETIEKLGKAN